jgi:excisionase family DNA binding protein
MEMDKVKNAQRINNPLGAPLQAPLQRLFTVKQAAQYLGRSVWAMRDLIWSGKIKVVRDGKRIFLDRVDLDSYIERTKTVYS